MYWYKGCNKKLKNAETAISRTQLKNNSPINCCAMTSNVSSNPF